MAAPGYIWLLCSVAASVVKRNTSTADRRGRHRRRRC